MVEKSLTRSRSLAASSLSLRRYSQRLAMSGMMSLVVEDPAESFSNVNSARLINITWRPDPTGIVHGSKCGNVLYICTSISLLRPSGQKANLITHL